MLPGARLVFGLNIGLFPETGRGGTLLKVGNGQGAAFTRRHRHFGAGDRFCILLATVFVLPRSRPQAEEIGPGRAPRDLYRS